MTTATKLSKDQLNYIFLDLYASCFYELQAILNANENDTWVDTRFGELKIESAWDSITNYLSSLSERLSAEYRCDPQEIQDSVELWTDCGISVIGSDYTISEDKVFSYSTESVLQAITQQEWPQAEQQELKATIDSWIQFAKSVKKLGVSEFLPSGAYGLALKYDLLDYFENQLASNSITTT